MESGGETRHRPYLYKTGDTFETRHGTMTVTGMSRIQREDNIFRKYYTLQCPKGQQYDVKEEYLKAGRLKTCKKCSHPTIMEAAPAFAAWFVDREIPLTRSCGCHDKADFYCPHCGRIVRGKSIGNVYKRRQVPCPCCANGVSYPERYMIALLEQLQVSFVHQYTVRFTRCGKNTHYKYDFYDRTRQLLIETHGQQHVEPGTFERVGGHTLDEIQQIDAEKEEYAARVLHLPYIALDCRKSDPNWIRREVCRTLRFYPLETVDWAAVQCAANQSVILQMIQLARQGFTQKQIGGMLHMNPSTVSTKLQKARKDGLYDGVTPRLLRAGENRRLQQAKQERARKERLRREALRQFGAPRRTGQEQHQPAPWEERKEKPDRPAPEITPLEPYKNSRTRLRFLCHACGQEFLRSPAAMQENSACPYCRKRAELQKKLAEKYGEEYEILGIYTDGRTPLRIRHRTCGEIFQKTAGEILRHGCPACGKRRRLEKYRAVRYSRGEEKFYTLLPETERRGYRFAGDSFLGLGKPHPFLCSHCGGIWQTTAGYILQGHNHICTSHSRKKTQAEYVQQVHQLVGGEYSVLGEYRNAFTPIKMRHNLCGLEYLTAPAHFTSTGRRCPVCSRCKIPGEEEKQQEYFRRIQALHAERERNILSAGSGRHGRPED